MSDIETHTNCPTNLLYTRSHEWVRSTDANIYVLGITHYAQSQLGDLVFVELPAIGTTVTAGCDLAVLESVKTAADVYAPITGKVIAINEQLSDNPSLVNQNPFDQGWLVKIEMTEPSMLNNLLKANEYQALMEG